MLTLISKLAALPLAQFFRLETVGIALAAAVHEFDASAMRGVVIPALEISPARTSVHGQCAD